MPKSATTAATVLRFPTPIVDDADEEIPVGLPGAHP